MSSKLMAEPREDDSVTMSRYVNSSNSDLVRVTH